MTTLADMKQRVINLIGDSVELDLYGVPSLPVRGGQTSAAILLAGIESALDAISSRIWKPSIFEISGGLSSADLPDDLIDVEGVRDITTGDLLPQIPLQVGGSFRAAQNGWSLYPSRTITFMNELGASGAKVYYSAVWRKPITDIYVTELDDVVLDTPVTLTTAIAFYATSYCLLERASQAAVLRQYNTKVDSGQPGDNPLRDMSNTFLERFEGEMKRFPQKQKGSTT